LKRHAQLGGKARTCVRRRRPDAAGAFGRISSTRAGVRRWLTPVRRGAGADELAGRVAAQAGRSAWARGGSRDPDGPLTPRRTPRVRSRPSPRGRAEVAVGGGDASVQGSRAVLPSPPCCAGAKRYEGGPEEIFRPVLSVIRSPTRTNC
jgi:hypothetical protein